MKKLVSMTSTHGKTPAEVAQEVIAAAQRFRTAGTDNGTDVTPDAPTPHGPAASDTTEQQPRA